MSEPFGWIVAGAATIMPVMDDNPFSAPQSTAPREPQSEPTQNDR
jgi:hypothetical protein